MPHFFSAQKHQCIICFSFTSVVNMLPYEITHLSFGALLIGRVQEDSAISNGTMHIWNHGAHISGTIWSTAILQDTNTKYLHFCTNKKITSFLSESLFYCNITYSHSSALQKRNIRAAKCDYYYAQYFKRFQDDSEWICRFHVNCVICKPVPTWRSLYNHWTYYN